MPRITANKDNSKWEERHLKNIARYQRQIDEIFKSAAREAASIAGIAGRVDSEKPFSFSDYPATKRRVDKLIADVQSGVEAVVVNGIEAEWKLANEKNDELCDQVFGQSAGSLTEAQRRQYYSTNSRALEQFRARKISGLSLSDRVWRYTEEFKDEMEMGIDIGIRDGMSADRLSRQLRQYLNYPDKLFRRVRDEHGNLALSRRARAFHPGQGVYRSSYKNARRLAATETNIAYRSADYERWKRLDFVVGIHVILSNNHTTTDRKGRKVPLYDICNELSGESEEEERGKYPKDFKFTGWHPNCRCHAISILKTQEEMDADNRRIMEGGEPTDSDESENAVSDVPAAFTKWVEANADRIEGAKSLPYFISDNLGAMESVSSGVGDVKYSRIIYNAYDPSKWDRAYFNERNGGYLVVDKKRAQSGDKSKNEAKKYKKEYDMAQVFAESGHRIAMLEEVPRVSSPDVRIDGVPAELKHTAGAGNIVKMAKKAITKQGARAVLFQFDTESRDVYLELEKLKGMGYSVYYFFTGKDIIYKL